MSNSAADLVWHYTTGHKFPLIVQELVLKPHAIGGEPKPVVWFSTNQEWEPTAATRYAQVDQRTGAVIRYLTKEMLHDCYKLFRFGVLPDTAPGTFEDFVTNSGGTKEVVSAMLAGAKELESDPNWWRVSFKPVPHDIWKDVQVWNGTGWVSLPKRA